MQKQSTLRTTLLLATLICCSVALLATNSFFSSFFHKKPPVSCEIYPVIIIGGGVGGLTTALNLAQNGIRTLVVEGTAQPGGLLTLSHSVRNWPGIESISGNSLIEKIKQHAQTAGATLLPETAASLDCSSWPYLVTTAPDIDGNIKTYKTTTIVIATGTTPRKLNISGEDAYWGNGVSNCAVCDGGLYKDKTVALIGGGEAAIEEAEYLSTLAQKVHMIVRKPSFSSHEASRIYAVSHNPKITLHLNTIPTKIAGDATSVTHLTIKNTLTDQEKSLKIDGIFEAIGSTPNSSLCKHVVSCNAQGAIKCDEYGRTSHPGVFAVGDVTPTHYRQAIIAAGNASTASQAILEYLFKSGHHPEIPSPKDPLLKEKRTPQTQHSQPPHEQTFTPDVLPAVIIGANTAGLAAAMYLGYAGYKPLVLDGAAPGGSLNNTRLITSWPSEEKITGAQLATNFTRHARAAGAKIEQSFVASITQETPHIFTITTTPDASGKSKTFKALSVILATSNTKGIKLGFAASSPGLFEFGKPLKNAKKLYTLQAGTGAQTALTACQYIREAGYKQQDAKTPQTTPHSSETKKISVKRESEVPHLSTLADFKKALKTHKNILIDCFATWCPPCKALKPVLNKIYTSGSFPDVAFYVVDVDEAEELAGFLGIRSMPTIICFSNGKEVARTTGFKDEQRLKNLIENSFESA